MQSLNRESRMICQQSAKIKVAIDSVEMVLRLWDGRRFASFSNQSEVNMSDSEKKSSSGGITIFTIVWAALAAFLSWQINHSIIWCMIHAVFGFFYVAYLCMGCGGGIPANLPW